MYKEYVRHPKGRGDMRPSALFVLLALAGTLAVSSSAQVVSATLTGTIMDSSGASVPNATVKVTEVSTGTVRTTATSTDGVYNLPYLNPGTYRIEVEASGFKKFVQDNLRLDVSTTARLDATLTPGSANETVTVTGEAPALQTDRAEVAKNFAAQSVQELPVANRNFQALAGLVAGVGTPA